MHHGTARIKQRSVKKNRAAASAGKAVYSILETIGNTPLIKMNTNIHELGSGVEIYAKAEWFNPGGSVKDRAALNMILEAEQKKLLTKDKTIIDATSGNTGIAYAMIASIKEYKVKLAVPANISFERKKIIEAYGAEMIFTDPLEGTDGAQLAVKKICRENPGRYFYPDQYNNSANWEAHYKATAVEILRQTNGKVTHFTAGLGTTGTFVGISRRLKEFNPAIQCIAIQPESPLHGLEGLKHLPTAIVPGIYDAALADYVIEVSTEESLLKVKELSLKEGIFAGLSSGAALAAALKIAQRIESGLIVTVFPDGGSKYLNEEIRSKIK